MITKKNIIMRFIAAAVLIGAVACEPETRAGVSATSIASNGDFMSAINRYTDPETGVVCYVYTSYRVGNLSCVVPATMPPAAIDTTRPR